MRHLILLGLALIVSACQASPTTPAAVPTAAREPGVLAARATVPAVLPQVIARQTVVAASLAAEPPIVLLNSADAQAQDAQQLAAADERVAALLRDQQGAPLRNEVFVARRATAADLTQLTAPPCQRTTCYRVEIYHYATNATTLVIVAPEAQQVLTVETLPGTQPNDVPSHLAALATEIAVHAPEVIQALGREPSAQDATMAQMKTALNATRCERAQHLCVAPTFRQGDRALWSIVDLTDLRLVGVQWTELGASGPPVTEKTLQDSTISARFCEQNTALERAGWKLQYILTSSDGLRVSDVSFNDRPAITSAALVDWHVSYSGQKQFGYSDAVGCPLFSAAAVAAYEPPEVKELAENGRTVGFALIQEFRHPGWPGPCQYYYVQQYNFYNDGRFRVIAQSNGRGCGNDGTYRPVLRIALAGTQHQVAAWNGAGWQPWDAEQWVAQNGTATPEGYQLRISGTEGGWYVAPGHGGAPDERGDNAFLYATVARANEGETDLPTIGPCCNADYKQGPEKFIEPEALGGAPVVLWYVAQLKNDDTPGQQYCWADSVAEGGVYVPRAWPCVSGPTFTPIVGQ